MAREGPRADSTKYPNNPNKLSPDRHFHTSSPTTARRTKRDASGLHGCVTMSFVARWSRQRCWALLIESARASVAAFGVIRRAGLSCGGVPRRLTFSRWLYRRPTGTGGARGIHRRGRAAAADTVVEQELLLDALH
jgi:hypothetical protein